MQTNEDISRTETTSRRRGAMRVAATAVASVVALAWPAAAGASGQDYECLRFEPRADQGAGIWTWGDHDLWVLEAGGEEFHFTSPAPGSLITTGNGLDIEFVRKCSIVVTPVDVPVEEPAVVPPEEPAEQPEEPAEQLEEPAEQPEMPLEEPAEVPSDEPEPRNEPTPMPRETLGSSPDPQHPDAPVGVPQPDDPGYTHWVPAPYRTTEAEVLGAQLAVTGPAQTAALAGVGVGLVSLGGVCLAASRRFGSTAQTPAGG